MTWARPDLFALLLLVPVVLLLAILAERVRRRTLLALASIEVLPTLLLKGVGRARTAQVVLGGTAMAALAVGAAGPRLGFEWQQQPVEGVSIVAVLDVSRSMDAADVSPSRMVRARRELQDFVGLLRGDAIGLVVFAAGPYVRIPLTVDYDTFLWAVEDSSTETIQAQGSDLAAALDAALGLLDKASGSGKAILLLSDGEGHQEEAGLTAGLARAKDAGVRIYTLGIGEPAGAPIPLAEGGFKSDSSGNVVLTRLDESSLSAVAAATGGAYVRAVPSDDDVRALYEGEIRGKLDAAERGVRREKLWHERFQWALAVALSSMALSAMLGIGRRAAIRTLASAAFVLLLFPADAWAGVTEDGLTAMREKRWSDAAQLLGQARVEDPGDVVVSRALAEALYRSGRFREAEQLFETLATTDVENKATHLFNAGNAAYRGGRLDDALQDFAGAGKADPKLSAAEKNAAAVQREIAARLKQQQDQQDQKDQGEQDQPEDGQPQDGQPQDGQPQDGEPQDGQPQDGQPQDGQPQDGQPQDGQPQDGQPQDGQPQDGTREATEPGTSGDPTADPGEEGMDISAASEGEGEEGGAVSTGQMTAEQATRLVDGVKEGTPRIVVGGRGSEKDW